MINYVYLKLYWIGFRFGFNIVKGNYDVWFTGQNPISYYYGIDIYNGFLYFDICMNYEVIICKIGFYNLLYDIYIKVKF